METLQTELSFPSNVPVPLVAPIPEQRRQVARDLPVNSTVSARHIRVLHVINGEHYSGAERVQDLLADCLTAEGFQVGFACIKPDRFPKLRKTQHAPLYELPMRGKFDVRPVWRLARLVRCEGYALIHAHTPRSLMIGQLAARLAGVPLIYHVHSPTVHDSTRRWTNWLNAKIERRSVRHASRMITVSSSLGRHMRGRGFSFDRISVVPNGVPVAETTRHDEPPQAPWTLGTVALFRPRKGMEMLLDALAILKRNAYPVRLQAVGPFETAEYESELMRRVAELQIGDMVQWTGFIKEVNLALAKMDLFVLPSLFGEGLPMVVLEAMAAGVPVVATRVEGVPEAIRDGQDGMIAEPGDAEDLARTIARVLDGQVDWSSLRLSAMQRHAQGFSDRSMTAGVARVYREVLGV